MLYYLNPSSIELLCYPTSANFKLPPNTEIASVYLATCCTTHRSVCYFQPRDGTDFPKLSLKWTKWFKMWEN